MDARYQDFPGASDGFSTGGDVRPDPRPAVRTVEVAGIAAGARSGDFRDARVFVVRPGATAAQLNLVIERVAAAQPEPPSILFLDGAKPSADIPPMVLGRCHTVDEITPAAASNWMVEMLQADHQDAMALFPERPCAALHATFRVRSLDDVERSCNIVARLLALEITASIGLRELVLNGVEHGNLGITFDEKSALLQTGDWLAEVNRRLEISEYRPRFVTVDVRHDRGETKIVISDQGAGFDWRSYVSGDGTPSAARHGRGISMAVGADFDAVEYIGNGSQVRLRLGRSGQASPAY